MLILSVNFDSLSIKYKRSIHKENLENSPFKETYNLSKEERRKIELPPNKYSEKMWELSMNPIEGKPNPEKLFELQYELRKTRFNSKKSPLVPGESSDMKWKERGPGNVGGRTKGLMFDPNDGSSETVFAGGVSGGLFKNTNISSQSSTWEHITQGIPDNIPVSSITYDPNNTKIFYVGTGESYTGAEALGNGLWKSSDGGNTWSNVFGGKSDSEITYISPGNFVEVTVPSGLGPYTYVAAAFGPSLTKNPIVQDLILANDGSTAGDDSDGIGGTTSDACQSLTSANAAAMNGNIALIERGDCPFIQKVKTAQDAGATLYAGGLNIGGTAVTSTAAELNLLDDVTSLATNVTGLSDALVEDNSIYIGNDPSSTTNSALKNIAIGITALDAITTGDENVAIGYNVLTKNTTGSNNMAIGTGALLDNISGAGNSAIGYRSLYENTTGDYNTANGSYSARENTTGDKNVAVGNSSLRDNTTGNKNTAVGQGSGFGIVGGNDNTTVGQLAGNVITTGSNNVIIGSESDPSANNATNQIVIGYGATGIGDNYAVIGNTDVTRVYAAQDGGAVIYANATINASDRRVKKEIQDLDYGLDYVKSLRPVSYFKKDPANYPQALKDALYPDGNVRKLSDEEKKLQVGFIAQEVKQVNDEMGLENNVVMVDEVGFHRMDYEKIVVPLVKAVQEQQEQIEALQRQYAQVTSQNQELMKLVSTQLLKKNDAEVKLIRSDESNNDDKSETVITSMK